MRDATLFSRAFPDKVARAGEDYQGQIKTRNFVIYFADIYRHN